MPNPTILIIDDDPTILEMFKMALGRADFDVITAPDGDIGLKFFEEKKPDLCLVDIAMPGIDGYQVVETMRKVEKEAKRTPPTPIIVLTAHEQPVMRDYAREIGVDRYLTKPVTPTKLVNHIKELLAQRKEKAASQDSA